METVIQTYQEVISYLNKNNRPKHLLLGNGFSMAYDSSIFSYNALNNFIESIDNALLKKLFAIIDNKNFELVMQQLDNFCEIANVFSADKALLNKITEASNQLKNSLIDAVKELHPEHVYSLPEEKSEACFSWLNEFLENNCKFFT